MDRINHLSPPRRGRSRLAHVLLRTVRDSRLPVPSVLSDSQSAVGAEMKVMSSEITSLALVAIGVALGLIGRNRTWVLPGAAVATVVAATAAFATSFWDWVRPGVQPMFRNLLLEGETLSQFRGVFNVYAAGLLLGTLLVLFVGRNRTPTGLRAWGTQLRGIEFRIPFALSVLALAIWIGGQGPSILARMEYTKTDGIDAFVRIGEVLVLPGFALAVLSLFVAHRKLQRVAAVTLAGTWILLLTAKGTRSAGLMLLLVAVLILFRGNRRLSIRLLLAGGFIFLSLISYNVAQVARTEPHGALNLIAMMGSPAMVWPVGSGFTQALQGALGSFALTIPQQIVSYQQGPRLTSSILAGLSPVPAAVGTDVDPERYFPYSWIPLSFIGEVVGALGVGASMALFATGPLLAGLALMLPRSSKTRTLGLGIVSLFVLQFVFAIQYASRTWFRFEWAIAGLTAWLVITELARKQPDVSPSARSEVWKASPPR